MTAETEADATGAPAQAVAPPRARARIIGLDGARGIACVAVLILHVGGHYSPLTLAGGKLQLLGHALVFFFALSGFLLYLPIVRGIAREREKATVQNVGEFTLHRVLRVFPGYIVIFLVCSFVLRAVYLQNPAVQPPGTDRGTGMMTNPLQLLANLTLVQTYLPSYFQTGLNPSWSLTLELVFYATLVVFGMMMLALRKGTAIHPLVIGLIAPAVLIVVGTVGKSFIPPLIEHYHLTNPLLIDWGPNLVAVYSRSFLPLADNFAYGMLAAIVVVAIEQDRLGKHLTRRIRWYCALAILPVVALALVLTALHTPFQTTAVALASGLVILFIVAPLARGEDSAFARYLDAKPLSYAGMISLSIYLWHFPILLVLGRFGWMAGDTVAGMLRNVVLVLALAMLAASVSYRYVERPAMSLVKRKSKRVR
jgi:peptidoglycan/LPS O-acetylase OafA/YrhL